MLRFDAASPPRTVAVLLATAAAVALLLPRPRSAEAESDYDPLAQARQSLGRTDNAWATVPPMCYTRTDGRSNPCWTCHTGVVTPNDLGDWKLQEEYAFARAARTNPWRNLFEDRERAAAAISDEEVLAWIRRDDYTPLRDALAGRADYEGYVPDLDFARGFDEEGFARDGSQWRALRYKPFPGTFWPTNGSADDTMIRLPSAFRADAGGRETREVYKTNLAILEASLAGDPFLRDEELAREVEPIDETVSGIDLDRDGRLGRAVRVVGLPPRYAGGAREVAVRRRLYPAGTEFLHSVRYLDPDAPGLAAVRMKELRYSRKVRDVGTRALAKAYRILRNDDAPTGPEAPEPQPPEFTGSALQGLENEFGWRYQGFIEDSRGRLRLQTHEEHLFCMGCHTGAGVTADQSFAFPRKVPGAAGWRPQDLRGMKDVPQVRHDEPEVLAYFRRVGGGDELRGNDELLERFFRDGTVDAQAVLRAGPGGDRDLAWLLSPSRRRALDLNRAYMVTVREQSFARGRDPTSSPVRNVWAEVKEASTGLAPAGRVFRDGRLHLDWSRESRK